MITDEEFIDLFNAWILSICDMSTALGHTINDAVRLKVRPKRGGYGLDKIGNFRKLFERSWGGTTEMKQR